MAIKARLAALPRAIIRFRDPHYNNRAPIYNNTAPIYSNT
jgi:hypothetical protein